MMFPSTSIARAIRIVASASLMIGAASVSSAQAVRALRPADLFSIEQIGATAWSPDGEKVSVEFLRSDRSLSADIPSANLRVLDVRTGAWRTIATRTALYAGFLGALWSPDGTKLLFLSVDSNAVVRPWIWAGGTTPARAINGVQLSDGLGNAAKGIWSDDSHVVFLERDSAAVNSGPMYSQLLTNRNGADRWRVAHTGATASVAVMQSRGADSVTSPRRLVSVDIRTGAIRELAVGDLRHPSLSVDRKTLIYWRQRPAFRAAIDTTMFHAPDADAAYALVNWGNEAHAVDLRTGHEVAVPDGASPPVREGIGAEPPPAPSAGARLKSRAGNSSAALYTTATDTDGTRLWLVRRGTPALEVWHGNAWVSAVKPGAYERVAYTDTTGRALTGWVLYPPGHQAGERLPVVTIVYPGTVYTDQPPSEFSLLNRWLENPELFAALGFAVVLPSIPYPEKPMQSDMIGPLLSGVLPLIDSVVARGIADPDRIALLGQSAGGYSVQAMITQTDRFHTAISTAGYSDLISLYGTFYGQYRHGDSGDPQASMLLRMLQFERGFIGAPAPPWAALDRYVANSPIFKVAGVHTPLMIVQGEDDFISVQQSEEYFSALYRQDKRAEFVRYYGEGHTISGRENVLDLWRRIDEWLTQTMPPRR
jgi:dipeptidyl aminopeptidase/acylaminoacyl peptidase